MRFEDMDVSGTQMPVFVRAGARRGRGCGTPPSDKYVFRNVVLKDVRGSGTDPMASSITGVDGCRIRGVRLENVKIACAGAGAARSRAACGEAVPYRPDVYPDPRPAFLPSLLPAYGLYVDRVDDFRMKDVSFVLREGDVDCRPDVVVTGADDLPEAMHDRGGVTFDFPAMSRERIATAFAGRANILKDPWRGTFSGKARSCVFAFPHTNGGVFRVSCRTKVRLVGGERAGGALQFRFGRAEPNFRETPKRNKFVWCAFVPRDDDWYPMTQSFEVRPGESHALLRLHTDACSVELEDLVVSEEPRAADDTLGLTVLFCDNLDGRFAVSEGQVGALAFFAAEKRGTGLSPQALTFRLTLPPGLSFLDASCRNDFPVAVETLDAGVRRYAFGVRDDYPIGNGGWFRASSAIIAAERGPGVCGEGRLEAVYDDGVRKLSVVSRPIRFEVVPTVRVSAPKDYRNGAYVMQAFEGPDAAARTRYAQFLSDAGCRWVIPTARDAGYPALTDWRACGFRVTPYALEWCKNAYKLWHGPVPEAEQFVLYGDRSKMRVPAANQTMCPLAVAARTPYYRSDVERRFRENVAGTDGLWANWEPYMYQGHGCVCLRCRKAFADSIGIDETTVASGWPTNALPGGVWAKEGRRFRSVCHGKLVKTVARSVDAVIVGSADPVGFIPGVFYEQMNSAWRTREPMAEAQEIDYAGDLRWISTWGPYLPWDSSMPYLVERGKFVGHCVAGRDVRAQVDRDYPAGRRPKLLAGPQGTCGDWVTQPENFEMAFDAYFFNRYEACIPWTFPVGADARYWRAFARATARAAKYEPFVRDGVPADDAVAVETVPEYAAPVALFSKRLPSVTNVVQLQTFAFDRDGARIVAVMNCWQEGEAFFDLKLRHLRAGRYEVVSEDGIRWTPTATERDWTAEALVRGIRLSVGAARTRVFEIRPVGGKVLTPACFALTAGRLADFYRERRPALAEAAARDRRLARIDTKGVSRDD